MFSSGIFLSLRSAWFLLLILWLQGQTAPSALAALPSPLDYGGVGNGSADDTNAFKSALAAKKTVALLGESYRITSSLAIGADTHVVGPGSIIVDFDTFDASPQNAAFNVSGDNVELRNFKLVKRYVYGSIAVGITAQNRKNLNLQDLEISGYTAGAGIRLKGCSQSAINSVVIRNFMLTWARDLTSEPISGISLVDCNAIAIQRCQIDHLEVQAAVRNYAPAGQAQGYLTAGIYLRNSRGINIEGCRFIVLGRGIDAIDSQNCVLYGNTFRDIWESGIMLRRSSYNVVLGNELNSCGQGILVQGNDSGTPPTPGTQTSNGNAVKGNQLVDIGAPGYFGVDFVTRTGYPATTGIAQLTGHTFNLVNDHVLARTPSYATGAVTITADASTLNSINNDNLGVTTAIGPGATVLLPPAAPFPPTTLGTAKAAANDWTLLE